MRTRFLSLTAVLLLSATAAQAQGPRHIVSANPFLPLVTSFQGEFETRVRENLAVAVAASHLDYGDDDDRITSADIKLRLYPSEKALEGFGIAAGLGVGRQSVVAFVDCVDRPGACSYQRRNATAPTFAVEMHYQWLLGRNRHTAVTVGGGAKRYFIDERPDGYDAYDEFRPTLRLTIGYAFR